MNAKLLSIQVGKPRQMGTPNSPDPLDRPWKSAFFKEPVAGTVRLSSTNLDGDAQANRRVHGGFDKAVLAYCAEHYPRWRAELGIADLPFGGFGENFTVAGQDESAVCIGDVYALGAVRVEVSQPRLPCGNLNRRWHRTDLMARVKANGRGGWYLRVLAEGVVEADMDLELIDRPFPEWTVSFANEIHKHQKTDRAAAEALAACPALAVDWREMLLND